MILRNPPWPGPISPEAAQREAAKLKRDGAIRDAYRALLDKCPSRRVGGDYDGMGGNWVDLEDILEPDLFREAIEHFERELAR